MFPKRRSPSPRFGRKGSDIMTSAQRKAIFGMCRNIGMTEDDRRALIFGLTSKDSTKELTDGETEAVIRELRSRENNKAAVPLEKRKPQVYGERVPGMMTPEQQSLAWRLIYRLQELDEKPMLHENGKPYKPAERLQGAIYKILGNNMARPGKDILSRIHDDEGEKLIEYLKRYVRSAERKAARRNSAK